MPNGAGEGEGAGELGAGFVSLPSPIAVNLQRSYLGE